MTLNIDNIQELTSIPKEYTFNYKKIEYLYQNNPNVFKNVDKTLVLSVDFQEKIAKLINEKTIILTKNNIKLLDSLCPKYIIDVLKNNFTYLYLINKHNFYNIGITLENDFIKLLESHQIKLDNKTPYLVTMCAEYVIKQYSEDKTTITNILPYFNKWNRDKRHKLIQAYFDKGNSDLSIFVYEEVPIFKDILVDKQDDKVIITAADISSANLILSFDLPLNITDIYILNGKTYFIEIITILSRSKEKNINLHVKNGFSLTSNLADNYRFLELCGNVGNIKLSPFEIEDFKQLLLKVKEHPGVVINIDLDNFMENEKDLLNLNTDIPINITSKSDVTILSLDEMKKLDKKLDFMVDEIKKSTLSPYEKYIAAYNIVKSFKKYRFYLDNKEFDGLISDQSRNPYLVLINQYIVCAGYTSLLKSLLKKLDIPSHEWILDVSENSEAISSGNFEKYTSHARLCVNIVDDKYGINGYFMSDPTFDNVTKENKDFYGYQYLSMSISESHIYDKNSSSYYYFSDDEDVFNDKMFTNPNKYFSEPFNIEVISKIIKNLEPVLYEKLLALKAWDETRIETIKKLFIEKTSQSIPLDKKYKAIISVLEFENKQFYSKLEKLEIYEKLYNIDHEINDELIISFNYTDFDTPIDFGANTNNKKIRNV